MNKRAYFTAYIDVYSGDIITWNIGLHPTVEFIAKPLNELIKIRPELNTRMTIHSDQVFQSMSRKAICLDNAMMESLFRILKAGTVHNHEYITCDELRQVISNYIYYYKNK